MLIRSEPGKDPLVLALDGGTGSCRAVLFDLSGKEVASAQREWQHQNTPGVPGGIDFLPQINGPLFDEIIREVVADIGGEADRIRAISTTSMREGMVLYDAAGAEIWACPNIDGRARTQAARLTESGLSARIYEIGGDWVSMTAPARFAWLAENMPETLARTRKFGMLSDWIATRLTGEFLTEPSSGSSTALFELRTRRWSGELISTLQLDASICPDVVESGQRAGAVTQIAAARTGLRAGTPVFAGGGDTQLALMGLARRPGDATLVSGSFWQMTAIAETAVTDRKRRSRTLCHARPGQWMIEAIGFLTGFSLRWFRDAFCQSEAEEASRTGRSVFDIIEEKAEKIPPGANGLHAIFASVMQTDSWTHAPPSFVGFDINNPGRTNRIACIRALMESGAFVSNAHRAIVAECTGQSYDRITMTGGSARGRLWPQIIADSFGLPVDISEVKETTALGAAILAAAGAGLIDGPEQMASGIQRTVMPDPAAHDLLQRKAEIWARMDALVMRIATQGLADPMWQAAGGLPRE